MASIIVTIQDETGSGKIINSSWVEFAESLVTVEQIIARRVATEVNHFNEQRKENYYGLIRPDKAEVTLNGFRMQKFEPIDLKKQISIAKEAFLKNGFFLLIDNLQAGSLDQTFVLHRESQISFIKLTPLVGG